MNTFLGRRLVTAVPVLLLVLLMIFTLARSLPGDPAVALLGPDATQQQIGALRSQLKLDQPVYAQFGAYLHNLLRGDLGVSLKSGQPVLGEIAQRLPATLELTVLATLLALLVGIPCGMLAAVREGRWLDQALRVLSLAGVSMPAFVLALLLQTVLSIDLGWLPISGRSSPWYISEPVTGLATLDFLLAGQPAAAWDALLHLVMPTLVLGSFLAAVVARYVRNSLLETLDEPFIRTARARGLGEWRVISGHALRNALLPAITVIGLHFADMLGGAILTETVFAWPGVGRFMLDAIRNRDYPVIQGTTLVFALLYMLVSLAVDVFYGVADPRLRHRGH
ncbi:ABC transporter permease [Pseudomonas putida]